MISDHDLLNAILTTKSIKYFWKDTERRFLGASQSFLDYYGFESVRQIIGRTDEDMYFLVNDSYYDEFKNKMIHREVKGIDVYMPFEDITSSVKQFLTVKSA